MAKWCVTILDDLPSQECVVEAASADAAMKIRLRDLADWADMAALQAEPVEEAGAEKTT